MKSNDEVSWWGVPRKIKVVNSLWCNWEFKWHERIQTGTRIHLHIYFPPTEIIDKWKI
jgi:hypothetical protein